MFNTCEGIENELSKHPVLPSQPLYRQYYMSNGNYLRKKKDNIWIYTLKIHVATLHKPPITRVLFWQWSVKIDQVQNKFRTFKEKCTSYLVGSERSYLCWQKKKKVKIYTAALGARTINITSSFFKLKLIFSSQITCQHQHIISSLSSAFRHRDSLERKRKNYRNE